MPLRTRLLLATITVVIAALATAGTATYLAFRSAVLDQVDQSLREVALPLAPDDDESVRGPVPTVTPFVQIRGADRTVRGRCPRSSPTGTRPPRTSRTRSAPPG